MNYDAILLIAFGAPEKMADVEPFLQNVLKGRSSSKARLAEVMSHYALFDGRSPLKEITFRQASALNALLRGRECELPVYVGMRNWEPYLVDTLRKIKMDGHENVVGFIMSVHQSEAGWDRYKANVEEARAIIGGETPFVAFCPGWHKHELFIAAVAQQTNAALLKVPANRRSEAALVFTAHSVPSRLPGTPRYVCQIGEGAELVAAEAGQKDFAVAYQSRSGPPEVPWLEPDVRQVIERLAVQGKKDVIIIPIGFVNDHIEVLYDLDVEASEAAQSCGINMVRAATVNDHPIFIEMMADVIISMMEG